MTARAARRLGIAGVFAAAITCGGQAAAQEAAASPSLGLELNTLEPSQGGCRLTFVVANGLGADVAKAAYEIALFDRDGLVERLTVLDFQALPEGKTRVRQFDLAETSCDAIGRVLVNDATACDGDGLAPGACIARLDTSTRTDVEFGT